MEGGKLKGAQEISPEPLISLGAEDGIRTRDPNLGKVIIFDSCRLLV